MIDSKFRKPFQPLFQVPAKGLAKMGISPIPVTVAALATGLLAGALIALGHLYGGLAVLWLSGFFDVLDGSLARLTGKNSRLGAFLDLIFDRMVEAAIIIGLYWAFPKSALHFLLFFAAAMFNFSTFVVAGALFPNQGAKSMHYDKGLIERTEAFIFFSLTLLFPGWIPLIMILFNSLMALTGLTRLIRIIRHEAGMGKERKQAPKKGDTND